MLRQHFAIHHISASFFDCHFRGFFRLLPLSFIFASRFSLFRAAIDYFHRQLVSEGFFSFRSFSMLADISLLHFHIFSRFSPLLRFRPVQIFDGLPFAAARFITYFFAIFTCMLRFSPPSLRRLSFQLSLPPLLLLPFGEAFRFSSIGFTPVIRLFRQPRFFIAFSFHRICRASLFGWGLPDFGCFFGQLRFATFILLRFFAVFAFCFGFHGHCGCHFHFAAFRLSYTRFSSSLIAASDAGWLLPPLIIFAAAFRRFRQLLQPIDAITEFSFQLFSVIFFSFS